MRRSKPNSAPARRPSTRPWSKASAARSGPCTAATLTSVATSLWRPSPRRRWPRSLTPATTRSWRPPCGTTRRMSSTRTASWSPGSSSAWWRGCPSGWPTRHDWPSCGCLLIRKTTTERKSRLWMENGNIFKSFLLIRPTKNLQYELINISR